MHQARETRDAAQRGSPLWVYLVTVTVLGGVLFGFVMTRLRLDELAPLSRDPAFWIVLGLIVFGELRPIRTPGASADEGATPSTSFTFALLLYAGPPVAIAAQALATLVTAGVSRTSPLRAAFNVAQYTLSLAAAAAVLQLVRVSGEHAGPWVVDGSELIVVAFAAFAYFVVNDALVGSAVALLQREPLLHSLRGDLGYQFMVSAALLGLSPLVVVTMNRSAALVPLFLLPLVAVYKDASVSMKRQHEALHDELTGLPNRKMLRAQAQPTLLAAARRNEVLGLCLLDIDRFKEVNDTLGHGTGDRLLRLVASRVRQSVRPEDLVARLDGDEFAVLLPAARDAEAVRVVANRVRAAIGEPFRLDGMLFDLEASVGIALFPDDGQDFSLLLQRADVAMYIAKEQRSGVEGYHVDKDRNSPVRLGMLGELRRAIDRGELELHYQPKISLNDHVVIGMEGLVRWRHPLRGLVPPDEFIPLAEQSSLMRDLTQYVVDTALAQAARWWRAGFPVQVAVNVSARDLLDSGLADAVAAGLSRHDVPADALQLEITERVLMSEPAHAADSLEALDKLGVPLSLDDFGTGYSSLVHLKRLPVREIKIDGSFVRRMADDADDTVIVHSIIDLASALGLRCVAEGVEDADTLRMLTALGCGAAQGWHFGKPMDVEAATGWLNEQRGTMSIGALPSAGRERV